MEEQKLESTSSLQWRRDQLVTRLAWNLAWLSRRLMEQTSPLIAPPSSAPLSSAMLMERCQLWLLCCLQEQSAAQLQQQGPEQGAGLLGARAARAARYGLSDADGAAALPPSPSPRSKSPAPSLTATMDSCFQVSEADLMEPAVQQQQPVPGQRPLRGASRDQLEGMLECVNRR